MLNTSLSQLQTSFMQKKISLLKQWFVRYHWKIALLILPFAILYSLFQFAPILWVLINGFIDEDGWSFAHYIEILSDSFYLQAFENSLWVSVGSALIGLIIAGITSFSIYRMQGDVSRRMLTFFTIATNFTGVPLAFAFIVILGFNGVITLLLKSWGVIEDFNLYGSAGVLLLYTYVQIPLGVLLLYPAFDALKPEWEDAAETLGASKFSYWLKVALPVLSPALLGTFVIMLANAMGTYSITFALTGGNYNIVTSRIASLVYGDLFLEPNLAAALSSLFVMLLGFITLIYHRLLKRSYHAK